jgi:Holliday junction resolvasome RuvABC endonuclease subunit
MNDKRQNGELVLAVFPSARGFGFAVFEGSRSLVDWGVRGIHGERKNVQSLAKVQELLDFYRPDLLVVEDYKGAGSRRAKRIEGLIGAITDVATKRRMVSASFSRADVRACFSHLGARTKREIAQAIAREFPELEPRLPPVRKIWMSEDARMNIFDAVALGMTFFHTKRQRKQAA